MTEYCVNYIIGKNILKIKYYGVWYFGINIHFIGRGSDTVLESLAMPSKILFDLGTLRTNA